MLIFAKLKSFVTSEIWMLLLWLTIHILVQQYIIMYRNVLFTTLTHTYTFVLTLVLGKTEKTVNNNVIHNWNSSSILVKIKNCENRWKNGSEGSLWNIEQLSSWHNQRCRTIPRFPLPEGRRMLRKISESSRIFKWRKLSMPIVAKDILAMFGEEEANIQEVINEVRDMDIFRASVVGYIKKLVAMLFEAIVQDEFTANGLRMKLKAFLNKFVWNYIDSTWLLVTRIKLSGKFFTSIIITYKIIHPTITVRVPGFLFISIDTSEEKSKVWSGDSWITSSIVY